MEIERVNCAANGRAHEEQQKMKEKEKRLMWSKSISLPIPRSERSIHVKTARKFHAANQQRKNLDGLYNFLALREQS